MTRRPPADVLEAAGRAIAALDEEAPSGEPATRLEVVATVGGGCIHPAVRLRAASGRSAFLKWSSGPGPAGFAVEARGLRALADRGGVPVPAVLGVAEGDADGPGWLLLDWIEPGPAGDATEAELGRGLAHLHRPLPPGTAAGWDEDGWIATLPQPNPPLDDWAGFWASARLAPQWQRARETGAIGRRHEPAMERLLGGLDRALEGWTGDGLSIVHGDLWSGNVLVGADGRAHLVDPAAYRGHREVDLAMMELFGGFGREVWAHYREAAPLEPGYAELRRPVYQLYPLLVHVNLFGGGYVDRTLALLDAASGFG